MWDGGGRSGDVRDGIKIGNGAEGGESVDIILGGDFSDDVCEAVGLTDSGIRGGISEARDSEGVGFEHFCPCVVWTGTMRAPWFAHPFFCTQATPLLLAQQDGFLPRHEPSLQETLPLSDSTDRLHHLSGPFSRRCTLRTPSHVPSPVWRPCTRSIK